MELSTMQALGYAGAFSALAFGAIGSALGCGVAGASAVGSWKKCFAQNKTAPFQLLIFAGAPFSQTIYGMIVLFIILAKVQVDPTFWPLFLIAGVLSGIAIGVSAYFQGIAAAGASDAQADTGKGFALYLMVLGIIETVAIFAMVFVIVLLNAVVKAAPNAVEAVSKAATVIAQ